MGYDGVYYKYIWIYIYIYVRIYIYVHIYIVTILHTYGYLCCNIMCDVCILYI